MNTTARHRTTLAAAALSLLTLAAGCSSEAQPNAGSETAGSSNAGAETAGGESVPSSGDDSGYLGSYSLVDEEFGTMVTVTVDGDTRTIETNALPDHETGEFPNGGNPNTISAQDLTWEFPTTATWTGDATTTRTTGVAVNGVKFEPGTGESVSCGSGETYRIEAIQEVYNLGLDFNNAHVQPGGEYHYHGISELLVDAYDADDDLVLVGFAADGYLMYYSKSGAYDPSYSLTTEPRTGTGCVASGPSGDSVELDGTEADGTYTSDWVYDPASGDLDECNGITIDGQYAYIVTDAYPYVARCLNGEAATGAGAGGPPGGGSQGAAPGAGAGGGRPGGPGSTANEPGS
jgi:hypothetical protein